MEELFSVNEAAAIAEISPDKIRTALEKKTLVSSEQRRRGKAVRHRFSIGDVLLVKLLSHFPFPLSKQDKQSLSRILSRGDRRAENWSLRNGDLVCNSMDVQVRIAWKPLREAVSRNLHLYRWGRRRVVSSPGTLAGEAVFRGTRVSLRHVASLFRKGVPEREIAEDFPDLRARDLAYARLIAAFGERPGRPRKRLEIERVNEARRFAIREIPKP